MMYRVPLILISLCFSLLVACGSPIQNKVRWVDAPGAANLKNLNFETQSLEIKAKWIKQPTGNIDQKAELLVYVVNHEWQRTDIPEDLELVFYATMPSMGHAMEDAGYFEKIDTGEYLNKNIRFNMDGDWRMELWLMDTDYNIVDRISWDEIL